MSQFFQVKIILRRWSLIYERIRERIRNACAIIYGKVKRKMLNMVWFKEKHRNGQVWKVTHKSPSFTTHYLVLRISIVLLIDTLNNIMRRSEAKPLTISEVYLFLILYNDFIDVELLKNCKANL